MHASISNVRPVLYVQRLGYAHVLFPIPTNRYIFLHPVVLTDPIVTNDLFPPGARAILGYGVNAPAGSPPGTSLIPSFLP
jgi:hypothetical protein